MVPRLRSVMNGMRMRTDFRVQKWTRLAGPVLGPGPVRMGRGNVVPLLRPKMCLPGALDQWGRFGEAGNVPGVRLGNPGQRWAMGGARAKRGRHGHRACCVVALGSGAWRAAGRSQGRYLGVRLEACGDWTVAVGSRGEGVRKHGAKASEVR